MHTEVFDCSDSVVSWSDMSRISRFPERAWETYIEYSVQSKEYREIYDLTAQKVQLNWRIFPGHTTTQVFNKSKKMMAEKGTSPSEFQ